MFDDIREFINKVDELGECKVVEKADWNLEIGTLTELQALIPNPPLLLFDKIKGYPAGYRVATNLFASSRRLALALGLPLEAKGLELVKAWRDRVRQGIKLIPPVEVDSGPIKENIRLGDQVNLFEFPAPKWRELDGGRFLGTGTVTITRDPDEGWVNLGTYRAQIHDKSTATIDIVTGHHGDIMRRKYWDKGLNCPAAVCCGQEPALLAAGTFGIPWGVSEYDYAGGLKNKPIEVTRGVTTDLPIPTTAEIVLEGEILPPEIETRLEGPFGEWPGYYASGPHPVAAFKVKSILYRNAPIINGIMPSILPRVWTLGKHIQMAATLWAELDRQLPGVNGVWLIEEATCHGIVVISLKQLYGGHAKQAALVAAGAMVTAYTTRYIIVVDEDIDPSNIAEVLWALGTRSEPEEIEVIRECWGSDANPRLTPEQRKIDDWTHSVGIILACKPYKWIKEFPPSIKTSPELSKKVREKWPELF